MQLIRELERTDETLRYFSLDERELRRTYGHHLEQIRLALRP